VTYDGRMTKTVLTLAHSPDPDDAFMWWPLTGKVRPDGTAMEGAGAGAVLDTGRFEFRAIPADIEALNRRAAGAGDLDITAMSVRAYADVHERYAITRCGASFGEGYGPKVVARADQSGTAVNVNCEECLRNPGVRIAIPGRRTTAFLMLGLVLGDWKAGGGRREAGEEKGGRFVEMPFDRIIGAVQRGEVEAGLVIHEGQLLFADAGLKLVLDVGAWWKGKTGLPLPLGVNAVRRDLDERFGAGTVAEVSGLLRRSVEYALAHRAEALEYTMPFALANARKAGEAEVGPTLERIDRYVSMYVTERTVDMGEAGRGAIERVLAAGAAAGLCPGGGGVELV
jgi:1,4-dihydroxy-6-naphthoate synthase